MADAQIGFTPPPEGFKDARWFAVDLHVPNRQFGFLHLDETILEHSVFLDNRIDAPWEKAAMIDADQIPVGTLPAANAGLLFHTSYCCSTLFARCLHLPPYGVALKEPLLFRRLCDARFAGWDVNTLLPKAVRLLTRPWHKGGSVLLKPTHVAHNIAEDLIRNLPQAKGLILTSTLEDFLLSNIKKPAETQNKVPELIKRALAALKYPDRFREEALHPPDFLCAVGLQWCAQQEGIGELLADAGIERLRVLQQNELLTDITSATLRAAHWLNWSAPQNLLEQRMGAVVAHHAKATARAFDANVRTLESKILRDKFSAPVRSALAWVERVLFPLMRSPALIGNAMLP
jgi:hypothetical protein